MDDAQLGGLLARALDDDAETPVDTARLRAGAHLRARRIRRRRRAGVAVLAVLAVAAVPAGYELLPSTPVAQVAGAPGQPQTTQTPDDGPAPDALSLPAPLAVPELVRVDGRIAVPDEAMIDLRAAEAPLEPLGLSLGTWTADSAPTADGSWPQALPCRQPSEGDLLVTEGLRELGSDDGAGATLYTQVTVYTPQDADEQWSDIEARLAEGTCEGGLVPRRLPGTVPGGGDGSRHLFEADAGDSYFGIHRSGRVVVQVALYAPVADRTDARRALEQVLDEAVARAEASGFVAAVEAETP